MSFQLKVDLEVFERHPEMSRAIPSWQNYGEDLDVIRFRQLLHVFGIVIVSKAIGLDETVSFMMRVKPWELRPSPARQIRSFAEEYPDLPDETKRALVAHWCRWCYRSSFSQAIKMVTRVWFAGTWDIWFEMHKDQQESRQSFAERSGHTRDRELE